MPELRIEETKRGSRKRILFFDENDQRTTSVDVVRFISLEPGEYPDSSVVYEQIDAAAPAVALERALRLLNYRERSVSEMRGRLRADGYTESTIDGLLERLVELQLIDDRRFAGCLVRSKRMSGWGSVRIERALQDAGISEQNALEALADDPGSEYERARAIASRRPIPDRQAMEKTLARLIRKGFRFDVALRAAKEAFEADSEGLDQ